MLGECSPAPDAPSDFWSDEPFGLTGQESSTEAGVGVESPTVTWAISTTESRLGELLTRSDVCHLHAERGDAERCGVLLDRTPELVRLDEVRQAVTASSGRCQLRRADGSGKTASLTVVVALNRLRRAPHSWIKPRN